MSHTPTPWTVTGQSETGRYITVKAAVGRTVARVPFSPQSADFRATDASDAQLIAAAPDLLEALRDMVDYAESPDFDGAPSLAVLAKARAALAKVQARDPAPAIPGGMMPWQVFERKAKTSAATVYLVCRTITLPNGYQSPEFLCASGRRPSKFRDTHNAQLAADKMNRDAAEQRARELDVMQSRGEI